MALKIGTDLPSLADATEWVNGTVTNEDLKGHPTLVHYWAISCGLCSEQMPKVIEWTETHGRRGLKVVGIHMPRSEADTSVAAVKDRIAEYGLKHPQAIDNTHAIVDRFQNQYVPAFYLFDAEGHLRQYVAGEFGLKMMDGALERVLSRAEAG